MKIMSASLRRFLFKIVFPSLLAIALFILTLFFYYLPSLEKNLIQGKREMIRELTNTTWGIFKKLDLDAEQGLLTLEKAQELALTEIRSIRYGDEAKDYFWITDTVPVMVMHPYRPELDGTTVSDITDPMGKRLFYEMATLASGQGFGYVDYMWQWKDDTSRIVPKLSYIKAYQPWGWIIGTGIYIEDVNQEIKKVEERIVKTSLAIATIIALLLFFITVQSHGIESRRLAAEGALADSNQKYRTLVEAATEGTLMVLDGQVVFANYPAQQLLGYGAGEFAQLTVANLFVVGSGIDNAFFMALSVGKVNHPFDTVMVSKPGRMIAVHLTVSMTSFGPKTGYIIILNEAQKARLIEDEVRKNREQFYTVADSLNIGIFRTTFGSRGHFIDANQAAIELFGLTGYRDIGDVKIFDLFFDREEKRQFLSDLTEKKMVNSRIVRLNLADGSYKSVSVSVVVASGNSSNPALCDGIVQDITARIRAYEEKDYLLTDLQASQFILHQPVSYLSVKAPVAALNDTIQRATELLLDSNLGALLVTAGENNIVGIVTRDDLVRRAIGEVVRPQSPLSTIMSSPLITLSDTDLVVEAIIKMNRKKISYLAVKNAQNQVNTLISATHIREALFRSHSILLSEIAHAHKISEVTASARNLPHIIRTLTDSGINTSTINRFMTLVTDSVTQRLIEFALDELGKPPAEFAFLAMGSEGRAEQTLKTDQDNAIIYGHVPKPEQEGVKTYFLKLGEMVCSILHDAGYDYCSGNNMARNPKWCQPLPVWKDYFRDWIVTADPRALLELNIFFDFRMICGKGALVDELRRHIAGLVVVHPVFLLHMVDNTLAFKSPIGLFGNIIESGNEADKNGLNLKEPMGILAAIARTYALKYNIEEANTLKRIEKLNTLKVIPEKTYKEFADSYMFLMRLRLKNQATLIAEGQLPDNIIVPAKLSSTERTLLKKVLNGISGFQSMLSYEFKGRG